VSGQRQQEAEVCADVMADSGRLLADLKAEPWTTLLVKGCMG